MSVTVSVTGPEEALTRVGGKARPPGEKATVGKVETRAVSGTLCGEPEALSVATRLALALPGAVALKAMARVQLAPAAREGTQVLDWMENSPALAPENLYEETDAGMLLVLVTVSTSVGALMPMPVFGKVMLVGEKVRVGCAGAVHVAFSWLAGLVNEAWLLVCKVTSAGMNFTRSAFNFSGVSVAIPSFALAGSAEAACRITVG